MNSDSTICPRNAGLINWLNQIRTRAVRSMSVRYGRAPDARPDDRTLASLA